MLLRWRRAAVHALWHASWRRRCRARCAVARVFQGGFALDAGARAPVLQQPGAEQLPPQHSSLHLRGQDVRQGTRCGSGVDQCEALFLHQVEVTHFIQDAHIASVIFCPPRFGLRVLIGQTSWGEMPTWARAGMHD
eukprot:366565-Chlamydomonas_euryale.AAC.20